MRLLIAFLLTIIAGSSGFSQTSEMRSLSDLSDQYTLSKDRGILEYSDVEGSPYLDEAFVPGEIVINDTMRYTEIPVRYNIYNDRIEFQTSAGQILEIDISVQSTNYKIGPQFFISTEYNDRGTQEKGILEILVDGDIQLYKQYIVDFRAATTTKGYEDAKPNRFIRQNDEYLVAIGKQMPESFRNSKALLEKLRESKPDIDQYVKIQRMKLRSEDDLVKLIQYCNN